MNINEMTFEQTEARLAEIRNLMDLPESNIDELTAEVDAIEERRKALIAAEEERKALCERIANDEERIETIKTFVTEERKMNNVEIRDSREYINAYANYIKSGKDDECRALLTENVSGTVPVPSMVYDIVKTAWEKDGIMSRVKKAYLKGNLKVGFEISSTGASIHTEGGDAVSEETLVLGIVELIPASIKKWISVSDEVVDMQGEAFLQYVYEELAYQIAKKAADTLVGKIIACGTQSTTTCVGVPQYATNTIAVDVVANAIGKLSDEASSPVVMMNKATWSAFKAVQYAGNYSVDPFEGLEVVFNNSIMPFSSATTTGDTYMIVGDLENGALANFPNGEGIDFKLDDKTDMAKDLVRILGREYVAVEPIAPNAFVKVVHA